MDNASAAIRVCRAVAANPEISNSTARIAAWLVGAAAQVGGFPLEVTLREVMHGFTRGKVTVQGAGVHYRTLVASLEWLRENGLITTREGAYANGGKHATVIDIVQGQE